MPTHCLRLPNVRFTRTFFSYTHTLQALAQTAASGPNYIPPASLNTKIPHIYPLTSTSRKMETDILPVDPVKLGKLTIKKEQEVEPLVEEWDISYEQGSELKSLQRA